MLGLKNVWVGHIKDSCWLVVVNQLQQNLQNLTQTLEKTELEVTTEKVRITIINHFIILKICLNSVLKREHNYRGYS
jgi:hypothetical protein